MKLSSDCTDVPTGLQHAELLVFPCWEGKKNAFIHTQLLPVSKFYAEEINVEPMESDVLISFTGAKYLVIYLP